MKRISLNRREVLILASVAMVAGPVIGSTGEPANDVHVVKDPGCGCCTGWVGILKNAGLNVTGEDRTGRFLTAFKIENNVPEVMMSCHTAKVGGYFIEGHVPVRDIKRLLRDRPDALGLAVPGMPYGSPGMGTDEEREAYDVFVVGKDGNIEVFQHYPQAGKAA